uniref:Solute carrier organic anion transporter family member n=1 Tax=Neogobius melanostomus TaxID=47308 RepID=A0A8C6SAR7_9GOBI
MPLLNLILLTAILTVSFHSLFRYCVVKVSNNVLLCVLSFFPLPDLTSGPQMFLVALSFAYFAKALSGSYLKSTITQLERRFDIPSYLIGVIDGSFEIGNLLVIAFVSYFGAKLHRPKIIAMGCVLMSIGTFIIALPHFIIGRYEFETSVRWLGNATRNPAPCAVGSLADAAQDAQVPHKGCEGESNLSMWIYVLLGNVLRGIGETPIQPLGISYIDDFATEENAALYVGCVHTISVVGPVFGYLLGSLCARIYVDIGFVKMESITITPADARWVGAWWLGYLIAGVITLLSAFPFWFLPRALPVSEALHKCSTYVSADFIPTLRTLLGHRVYLIYLCVTIIQLNSLIGMVTYKPKYIEQHFRQSASKANFLMGVINIPAVALGMFSGGLLMKRLKLNLMGAARFAFGTSLIGYVLSLFFFALSCDNANVAGVTVPYSSCNQACSCSESEWDPVCGNNGITYMSACLAGCTSATGSGKNTIFSNCSCVGVAGNFTARAGQCNDKDDCDRMFPYFLALSEMLYFGLCRCIKPQLKALALGFHALATRTLAGIPAPIYFGAIIDTTCLKWGQKRCGGIGACRIYNTTKVLIPFYLFLLLRKYSYPSFYSFCDNVKCSKYHLVVLKHNRDCIICFKCNDWNSPQK